MRPVIVFIHGIVRRAVLAWLGFWLSEPSPNALLALLRIGTALMILFLLFSRSFDPDNLFSSMVWSDPAILKGMDPIAWPFSLLQIGESESWNWVVYGAAIAASTALLAGVWTPLAAATSLMFQLSYAHHNPMMLLEVEGLLILSLAYLSLAPSGRVLGVLARAPAEGPPRPVYLSYLEDEPVPKEVRYPWSSLVVRMLQIHLCLIYFQSALARLSTDWLAGTALWHPRLVELGVPYSLEALRADPYLTSSITYGLVLFELFYPVLIWIPQLRYAMLALAVAVHLTVGEAWGLMPFNAMMILLNVAFIPPRHLEALLKLARPFLLPNWLSNNGRR